MPTINSLKQLSIDTSWTLFLDRDGVINKKINHDYVRTWEQFEFLPNVLESLAQLSKIFGKIVIVTNQRGVGRGIMTENALNIIHQLLLEEVAKNDGRIDAIYFCPDVNDENSTHRKPKIGMALDAAIQFPEIVFSKSIMVGDAMSDIEFGKNAGMITIGICKKPIEQADYNYVSLNQFCDKLISC